MKNIMIAVGFAAFLFGAYWAGGRIAAERCRADTQERVAAATAAARGMADKQRKEINAKVYNTGGTDIRRMLQERYTIAD